MTLLHKTDLKYNYSWIEIEPDNPRVTGLLPETTLLNRRDGYEVLAFINNFSFVNNWKKKEFGLKAERLIQKHLPENIRSHAHVKKWLIDNWRKFD